MNKDKIYQSLKEVKEGTRFLINKQLFKKIYDNNFKEECGIGAQYLTFEQLPIEENNNLFELLDFVIYENNNKLNARAIKHLNGLIRLNGKTITKKEMVEELYKDKYTLSNKFDKYECNNGYYHIKLTKMQYDYFSYLNDKKGA